MKSLNKIEIIGSLAKKLGHEPNGDEIAQELNGVGLLVLADKICGEPVKTVTFSEDLDSELHEVPIPDINGEVRCPECLSFDDWKNVDADWDPETNQQWFTYFCKGYVSYTQWSDFPCEARVTIYLDENLKPVFPKK